MARDSFLCNASILGLWFGTGGGLWLEIHFGLCNASIVGLWLGTGGGRWLEV